MTHIAGADGCPGGWISICREVESGKLRAVLFDTAPELILQGHPPEVLAVDIPIGLTERGQRACDVEARQALGWPRRSSVFPPPVRGVLPSVRPNSTRLQISDLHRRLDGRRIGAQAWGIVRKIKEVDDVLSADSSLQQRVREVHPEVSFWAWAAGPMQFGKKTRQGRDERRHLVDDYFGREAVWAVRTEYKVKEVGHDDILDAFAALWTAERILGGTHRRFPEEASTDTKGLRMEIVY